MYPQAIGDAGLLNPMLMSLVRTNLQFTFRPVRFLAERALTGDTSSGSAPCTLENTTVDAPASITYTFASCRLFPGTRHF